MLTILLKGYTMVGQTFQLPARHWLSTFDVRPGSLQDIGYDIYQKLQ